MFSGWQWGSDHVAVLSHHLWVVRYMLSDGRPVVSGLVPYMPPYVLDLHNTLRSIVHKYPCPNWGPGG